jgi:hypothetical protein
MRVLKQLIATLERRLRLAGRGEECRRSRSAARAAFSASLAACCSDETVLKMPMVGPSQETVQPTVIGAVLPRSEVASVETRRFYSVGWLNAES